MSSFLGPRQETTRTAFCNYLVSEVEALEDRDFQTHRNETVKLLSSIQSRAEERSHQPQQPEQPTLSRSSSVASTFVLQIFQQPQQTAPAAREYILTIKESQISASQAIQPTQQSQVATKGQQQPRVQPIFFVVLDHQQPGPSRLFAFILSTMKHFNQLSVAFATGEQSEHNLSL